MKYNSVIFDMDGVILDFEGENFKWKYDAVRKVLKEHGKNPEKFSRRELDAFIGDQGVKKCVELCNSNNLNARDVWEEIAEETTRARAKKIKEGDFQLFPEVKDVIEELHGQGVELGLVSNAPEMALMETVEYFDLKNYFKFFRGIEDFDDLSDRKPQPDHLNFARAELKHEPHVFIGDHESDILAAQNAEMDSVWVNRNSSSIDVRPDHEIESLDELKNTVKLNKSEGMV